ncbi:MAG: DUF4870 domain-containing protein [Caldisericota bacterium]|nr:DUF4870 domain-containing protein [Caldisericota bacterium]
MKKTDEFDVNDVQENKVFAALSYLGILVLIPLLVKKDSKFAMEHAKQGLVLFIIEMILWVINFIPVLGQILWIVVGIILFIVSLMGLIYALQGKFWKIPFVYDWAQNFKL